MSASDNQDTTHIPAVISHGADLCHTICIFAGEARVQMETSCSLFPCLLHEESTESRPDACMSASMLLVCTGMNACFQTVAS